MRRLIINADDLGLTLGVNKGIFEAHARGVVTSATLMANSHGFEDAVTRIKQAKDTNGKRRPLSVGCHVVLIDGAPLTPADRVPTLAPSGAFRESLAEFAISALRGRIRAEDIAQEATAQMEKITDAGIRLTHFDTHKHTHLFPSILRPLLEAAHLCGVRAVRNPFAPLKPLAWAHLARRPRLWKRYSEVVILRRLGGAFQRAVESVGLKTTDGTFGIVVTGVLDERLFDAIAGCIPEGTWEFVCHPGYNDTELQLVRTRLRESRARELEVLTSDAARKALESRGIELISYADL